ncbi:MAG: hypothetical protein OJF49_003362 [Ktedonobacterales bacterium]|jgi:hypothetical protein|nr:MAG: hypothetical protein OJF49_003362 [Ktedonobacterales bacterium]
MQDNYGYQGGQDDAQAALPPPSQPYPSYSSYPTYPTYPPPAARPPRRRWLLPGLLALAFALTLGIGALFGSTLLPNAQAASNVPGITFAGRNAFAGGAGTQGQCGVLTVSSVSGQTIVATAQDGSTVTIHTTSSTQYTRAGQAATASAVTAGSKIHVDGTRNSDGSITATRIDIQ